MTASQDRAPDDAKTPSRLAPEGSEREGQSDPDSSEQPGGSPSQESSPFAAPSSREEKAGLTATASSVTPRQKRPRVDGSAAHSPMLSPMQTRGDRRRSHTEARPGLPPDYEEEEMEEISAINDRTSLEMQVEKLWAAYQASLFQVHSKLRMTGNGQ